MREIVDRDEKTKEIWDRDKAINHFKKGEYISSTY